MVNFADAVTKVSYGNLRTVTPNAKGVEKFLHNIVKDTQTSRFGAELEIGGMNITKEFKENVEKQSRKLAVDKNPFWTISPILQLNTFCKKFFKY